MKFLVAYNGSTESKAALDLAITHASTFKAKVIVITSMEGGHSEKPEDIARVNQELKWVRQQLENRRHRSRSTRNGQRPFSG